MIEVFDEKDVEECLSEVKDSNIKTYAFCLLDWAVQKRKVQAIPLEKVKQAREKIKNSSIEVYTDYEEYDMMETADALKILDELIKESEG